MSKSIINPNTGLAMPANLGLFFNPDTHNPAPEIEAVYRDLLAALETAAAKMGLTGDEALVLERLNFYRMQVGHWREQTARRRAAAKRAPATASTSTSSVGGGHSCHTCQKYLECAADDEILPEGICEAYADRAEQRQAA